MSHWIFGFGSIAVMVVNIAVGTTLALLMPELFFDYAIVWCIGILFSAIELGSRYKDDPWSVIASSPGFVYLLTNGLVCCFGLYMITIFNLTDKTVGLSELAIRTRDILFASLGSFFIMRSSFLKLGSDNSQLDLGLNLVLKKLLEMIDRQVDRLRANRRSEDITTILKNVSYEDFNKQLYPFCIQVMQNITQEEREKLLYELKTIDSSEDSESTKKLSAGLQVYNIVGRGVLKSAVEHLGLEKDTQISPQSSLAKPDVRTNTMIMELIRKHPALAVRYGKQTDSNEEGQSEPPA